MKRWVFAVFGLALLVGCATVQSGRTVAARTQETRPLALENRSAAAGRRPGSSTGEADPRRGEAGARPLGPVSS